MGPEMEGWVLNKGFKSQPDFLVLLVAAQEMSRCSPSLRVMEPD